MCVIYGINEKSKDVQGNLDARKTCKEYENRSGIESNKPTRNPLREGRVYGMNVKEKLGRAVITINILDISHMHP
jgi:hypothetical protein